MPLYRPSTFSGRGSLKNPFSSNNEADANERIFENVAEALHKNLHPSQFWAQKGAAAFLSAAHPGINFRQIFGWDKGNKLTDSLLAGSEKALTKVMPGTDSSSSIGGIFNKMMDTAIGFGAGPLANFFKAIVDFLTKLFSAPATQDLASGVLQPLEIYNSQAAATAAALDKLKHLKS